jgi:SnoaL-like domain
MSSCLPKRPGVPVGRCASLLLCLVAGLAGPLTAFADQSPADAALQTLEQQLNGIGNRLTRLQDLTDIEIVQHAYGYFVDKAQWHALTDLFAADATLEIGGKGVFLGHDRVFEYMQTGMGPIGPHDGSLIDHQQFQCLPSVDLDGATGHIRCIAFVMSSGGWGHVYYENVYTKDNGIWKFKKLRGPFNMYGGYKMGWLDNTMVNTFPEKFPPWPDLPPTVMYLTYPNYYAEPFDYPNPVTGRIAPPPSPRAGGMAFGASPVR